MRPMLQYSDVRTTHRSIRFAQDRLIDAAQRCSIAMAFP